MVLRSMITVSRDRLHCSIIQAKSRSKVNTTLAIDLSQNWVNATVTIHSITKPSGVPNVNVGSLWYDESTDLLYTGYTGARRSFNLSNGPPLAPVSIWTFKSDNVGGGSWNQAISSNASVWNNIKRSAQGYQAYGNGSAYVLGGTSDLNMLCEETYYPGLIRFDMSSLAFSNISTKTFPTYPNGTPSCSGTMQYVPFFGSHGIFLIVGGDGSDGSTVQVFDPASGAWYNQTTTGSVPTPLDLFCTAGAASTNGTYEIFVYPGFNGVETEPLDTVYILSLPAFNWFSIAIAPQRPRAGHTCEAVGGSQILTVGANWSNVSGPSTGNNVSGPSICGNMSEYNPVCGGGPRIAPRNNIPDDLTTPEFYQDIFTTPDPFAQGLAIFDLRTMDFAPEYIAGGGAVYEPNEIIAQFYAQGPNDGNLVEGVFQLMKETQFPSATSPNSTADVPPATSSNSTASNSTSKSPSSSAPSNSPPTISAGSITGGVIGGLLGIAMIIALVLWLLRRRRRKMRTQPSQPPAPEIDGNARAELQQRGSRLELGSGEAHEKDGNARGELGYGEAHEKDCIARAELPG